MYPSFDPIQYHSRLSLVIKGHPKPVIKHRRLVRLVHFAEAGFLFLISVGMALGVLHDGHELFQFSRGNYRLPLIGVIWSALAIAFFVAGCRLTKKATRPDGLRPHLPSQFPRDGATDPK